MSIRGVNGTKTKEKTGHNRSIKKEIREIKTKEKTGHNQHSKKEIRVIKAHGKDLAIRVFPVLYIQSLGHFLRNGCTIIIPDHFGLRERERERERLRDRYGSLKHLECASQDLRPWLSRLVNYIYSHLYCCCFVYSIILTSSCFQLYSFYYPAFIINLCFVMDQFVDALICILFFV